MTLTNSERNARSRQRLRALVDRLDDETLRRQTDADWTIGAILANMAGAAGAERARAGGASG